MNSQQGQVIQSQSVPVRQKHGDLSQEVIEITVDRLSLILTKHVRFMEKRREWMTPLSLLVTLALVFVTSNFKDFVVKSSTWEAFFMMAAVITAIWCFLAVRQTKRARTIEDLVTIIKEQK